MRNKFLISFEQLEKFKWHFKKGVSYDDVKRHKKTRLHTFSEKKTFLEKQQGDRIDPLPPPSSLLRVDSAPKNVDKKSI